MELGSSELGIAVTATRVTIGKRRGVQEHACYWTGLPHGL